MRLYKILGIGLDVLVGIVAVIIGVISLVASLLILLFLDGIICSYSWNYIFHKENCRQNEFGDWTQKVVE